MERSINQDNYKRSIIIFNLSINSCSNEIDKKSQNPFLIFSMGKTICPLEISIWDLIYIDRDFEQLSFNLNDPEKNRILSLIYVLKKLGFSSLRNNLNLYNNIISNSLLNSIKKFWDNHISEFVNIINYCISKKPDIFINKRLIDLIIEKLEKNDESVLPILTTSFEHWVNNNYNFINLAGLLNKIKVEKLIQNIRSSKVEEFFAAFIIFLYEQSKQINNYFTGDYLEKLVDSFIQSKYKPDQPWFERTMRAIICICNYYCETNNRDKAISWFESILQKIFPYKKEVSNDVNTSNKSDESYLYLKESCNNSNESPKNLVFNDNNESCFVSCDSDSSNNYDKSENLFDNLNDYCPYKNNDIYYYIESDLHIDLKGKILDIIKSNGEFDDIMKFENFLKLWSISDDKSTQIIPLLKDFINKNLELNRNIEIIAKIIIFSPKPVELKEDFYAYINYKLIKKAIIDKEDIFRLFQKRFDTIYNDFNHSQKEKKNIIINFCSLLIDNSNCLYFQNQIIDLYIKKYDIKDTNYKGRRLFIKYIINHYIQICFENNNHNNFCLGLDKLILKFLPSNKIDGFPDILIDYMTHSKDIYSFLYVLNKMSFIINSSCRKCFTRSVECLAVHVKKYYDKEILIFFKDVLEIFKIKNENTLYNLCKTQISKIIKKYNNNPDNKIQHIHSQIENIFINDNCNNFSNYPSLCVKRIGKSCSNNEQLNNYKLGIPDKKCEKKGIKYERSIVKQDNINTIELSEELYTSRNNDEMAKIGASKKNRFNTVIIEFEKNI